MAPAIADETLAGKRIAGLVREGYTIEGTSMAIHKGDRPAKLFYRTSTLLVREGDVVQCFQSFDEFYQLEFYRCNRLSGSGR